MTYYCPSRRKSDGLAFPISAHRSSWVTSAYCEGGKSESSEACRHQYATGVRSTATCLRKCVYQVSP